MEVNKKATLIGIIFLLIIFVPSTILGIVGKVLNYDSQTKNTNNQEFLFEDKLHFYNDNELLSTYSCSEGYVYCGLANETIDDQNYQITFYNDQEINQIPIIDNRYAFIIDTNLNTEEAKSTNVKLFDIKSGIVITEYEAVKNYTLGITNNKFIVKTNGKWGMIEVSPTTLNKVIDFEYDFIGTNKVVENQLSDQLFIYLKDNNWGLINNEYQELEGKFSDTIISYDENFVITSDNFDRLALAKPSGEVLLQNAVYKSIDFINEEYVTVIDTYNMLSVFDLKTDLIISQKYSVTNIEDFNVTIENNEIIITKNEQELERITLNQGE